jgi:hypothetical protein
MDLLYSIRLTLSGVKTKGGGLRLHKSNSKVEVARDKLPPSSLFQGSHRTIQ